MTTTPPEAPPQESAAQPSEPTAEQEPKPEPSKGETDWKAEAKKWEQRAKDNRKAAQELEKQREASMTEAEKAVADAEKRGRTTAISEFGTRLARTEFDAAAARRNSEFDTRPLFDDELINLSRFVGDNGDTDTTAISAAVERLVPAPAGGPPSFDGGSRTPPDKPQDMTQVIRRQLGRT